MGGRMNEITVYQPKHPIRIVTATALFDGHDASINIMRRILQGTGVEVIHLAHNRSVEEIVKAAIEEDVQGIAVSSYQGGHVEFFKYMLDLLKQHGASHVKVFGGGGGVIVPDEIRELEAYGVSKIYTPEDGTRMGLQGIINHMVEILDFSTLHQVDLDVDQLSPDNSPLVAKMITAVEQADTETKDDMTRLKSELHEKATQRQIPVIGITGTGGAGKSSLTDEILLRFLLDMKDIRIAVISSDPSRRKTGGALLGDRIRMNSIKSSRIYMRSLATRRSLTEIPESLTDVIHVVKAAGFDLIIAETAGIGQGDSNIVNLTDISMYVMTSEFGAASQLEKIDMLDFADLVVINKFEKRGGEDAVRDVRKQVQRNRNLWESSQEEMPVFGTIASKFNDDGVTALYHAIITTIQEKTGVALTTERVPPSDKTSTSKTIIIPPERTRYLSDIVTCITQYHKKTKTQAELLRDAWHLKEAEKYFSDTDGSDVDLLAELKTRAAKINTSIDQESHALTKEWEEVKSIYSQDELIYNVRNQEIRVPLFTNSLSHQRIPKISLPEITDPGEAYCWMRE